MLTSTSAATSASADHSRFVQRIRRRYGDELGLLPPGLPRAQVIGDLVRQLVAGGRTLASALRVTRQLVLERLAVLDIEQGASLADITVAMTELAETTLDVALAQAMGAEGLREQHPFARHLMGARVAGFVDGSTEMLLERICILATA